MAPNIPTAQTSLSYPLYAADFDPSNPAFLLVGGGGGEGRSGVGNKIVSISLLNVWKRILLLTQPDSSQRAPQE